MSQLLKLLGALTFLLTSNTLSAAECNETCQLEQVNAYFAALDRVSKKDSTVNDIDNLLALTHDDVKYIHLDYQANFTKDAWRKAFLRNLELGRYQKTEKNQIRILRSIPGKKHVAIEYSHGVIKQDGQWKKTDNYLAIFGFTDGQIFLIKELW